jgi:hypothetical protein
VNDYSKVASDRHSEGELYSRAGCVGTSMSAGTNLKTRSACFEVLKDVGLGTTSDCITHRPSNSLQPEENVQERALRSACPPHGP